ncbi:MAG: 2-amino-4-hydroxy-6-hydroxymethyldihydropteridine diphosphokinase [Lachnospiraceae bacterium]
MDEIRIDNLEVYAHHGVFPEENEKGQHFYLNAVLYVDTRKAGTTDELTDSTHYGLVCEEMTDAMTEHTWKLIESAAEYVAERVLLKFPLVRAMDLEVRKPEAPIPLPFESVSVKIHRGWHTCYIALGSNLGDSEKLLTEAVAKLRGVEQIRMKQVSSFIKTAPYGGVEQPDFLNGAVCIETLLPPHELLDLLHVIEREAGRERKVHWGPRTLDLDILFYDDVILYEPDLMIPHIDLENRTFVLLPMCELNPLWKHPVSGKSMKELLNELQKRVE